LVVIIKNSMEHIHCSIDLINARLRTLTACLLTLEMENDTSIKSVKKELAILLVEIENDMEWPYGQPDNKDSMKQCSGESTHTPQEDLKD